MSISLVKSGILGESTEGLVRDIVLCSALTNMSLLTGGTADKLGNRYEEWWMVLQLIRAIEGEIENICIEDSTVEKSECLITSEKGEELHQNKRSKASGSWTLSQLGEKYEDILAAIFRQLVGNNRSFHFVSGSDAPHLKALTEQARLVPNVVDFREKVLSVSRHDKSYQTLKGEWSNPDDAEALDVLKRVFVRVIDEEAILDQIRSQLGTLFLSGHPEIRTILREMVTRSVGVTLTGEGLRSKLKNLGHQLRTITDSASASRKVEELSDQYIAEIRRKLIGQNLIRRNTSKEILDHLQSATEQTDILLVSDAGGGKSVCLMEVSENLRDAQIPVLAFRLDRLKPTTTGFKVGEQMGLEESPAFVLSNLESGKPAVLIIDQLDAVSTASGRSSEFINAVESILEDVRALKRKKPIHVVLACRQFDLNNDHRLRKLTGQKNSRFQLGDFSRQEVEEVLETLPIDASRLNERQLKLLGRPQNLSLFSQLRKFSESVTRFGSTKDLFDAYWTEKREAVSQRFGAGEDYWAKVIDHLAEQMTKTQQLSVGRECLDEFPQKYLEQMISEGVISLQSERYGFGHESFFDYCFARRFVRENDSLVSVLVSSEQHLFRRAQVRQILAYLRDSNHGKYSEELGQLLNSSEIRIHIKDLALSILASAPSVMESEWLILEPWLKAKLKSIQEGTSEPNAFTKLVWQHFFFSNSWFLYAHSIGLPGEWLGSDCENLVELGANYVSRHQRENGCQIAELLAQFKDAPGIWRERLKGIMQWAALEKSRSFFELFLHLVSNGYLDEARGPIAVNSTFWDMVHGLDESQPAWVIELVVIWLRRRVQIIHEEKTADENDPKWSDLFPSGQSGAKTVIGASKHCSREVVETLLPLALELAEQSSYGGEVPPFRDAAWGYSFNSKYPDLRQACDSAICSSVEKVAKDSPRQLDEVISDLRGRRSYFSNRILLRIFTAGAEQFADQALSVLEDETWRFRCGHSDSSYWIARCLVGAIATHLSDCRMRDLENLVLGYRSTWEQTERGRKAFGDAVHTLAGAIPKNLLSESGQKKIAELERKFGSRDRAPRGMKGGVVVSPISSEAEEKMTDDQWRSAIKKYSSRDRDRFGEDFLKGGAYELAHSMGGLIKKEPERFGELALSLPEDTNAAYIESFLRSLAGTECPVDLKLRVARRAFEEHKIACGRCIADLLGSIEVRLDDEFVNIVHWLAIEHPNPDREKWQPTDEDPTIYYGGKISDCGLNSDRGRAVLTIANLIRKDEEYIQRFEPTFALLSEERTLSVKSCVLRVSYEIFRYDEDRALALFLGITQLDPRLLAIHYSDNFLAWVIQKYFEAVESSLLALLRSQDEKESKIGARLLALAKLYSHPTDQHIDEALNGTSSQRHGVAKVAAKNLGQADTREWCETILIRLFSDSDSSVRACAADCFREISEHDISKYNDLVKNFSGSPSFKSNSSSLMRILEETKFRLPELTMNVCEDFILQISPEDTNAFSQNYVDSSSLGTLVFRVYQQYQSEPLAVRALDLIDDMIVTGLGEANRCLSEFER